MTRERLKDSRGIAADEADEDLGRGHLNSSGHRGEDGEVAPPPSRRTRREAKKAGIGARKGARGRKATMSGIRSR